MAVIKKNGGFMALPINIKRGNPIPLDASSVWYSLAEMEAYAKDNPTAYVGQILSLVDEASDAAKAYIIVDAAGTLVEIGTGSAASNTDDKSIVLDEESLALKDFGKRYYKYVEAHDDVEASYVLQEVDNDNPWLSGLEPKVGPDGTLAWYQPNPTTVEGLQSQMGTLSTQVNAQGSRIGALETTVNGLTGAFLFKGSVESEEALNAIENPNPGDIYQVGDSEFVYTAGADGEEGSWIELGSPTDVDLSAYSTTEEANAAYAPIGLVDRVETLENINPAETATAVSSLEAVVGHAVIPAEEEGEQDTPATGLVGDLSALTTRVAALEMIEPGEKNVITSLSAGETPLMPESGNITIPIFSGTVAGLVADATEVENKTVAFLNAEGNWAVPIDTRIGTLTYNETTYSTVTEYIDARIDDAAIVWEAILEE